MRTTETCWADPLTVAERRLVAVKLANACGRFWRAAEPRLPDARSKNALAYALVESSAEMSDLHLDVTERAELASDDPHRRLYYPEPDPTLLPVVDFTDGHGDYARERADYSD